MKEKLSQEQIDAQQKKEARQKYEADRKTYKNLVDFQVENLFPHIEMISSQLATLKKNTYKSFDAAIALKRELYGERVDENLSHMFSNEKNDRRITIGNRYKDDWDDTITAGIDLAKQRIEELAVNEVSQALVKMVLSLLSKNSKGELKASKILQLRRIAQEQNDEKLLEAVEIIERAHKPSVSATFILAEKKNAQGQWIAVPLSTTSEE